MIGLGLDAATSTGWGIVDVGAGKPRVITYGVACGTDHAAIEEVIATAISHEVNIAGLEIPYVDKNIDTALKLGYICGRWSQELDRAGMKWLSCRASTWQHKLLNGLITPSSTRDARKRAAKSWVWATFGLKVSEDEADGICLATWRAKQSQYDKLTGVGK